MGCCSKKRCGMTLVALGLVQILAGGLLVWGVKQIIKQEVYKTEVFHEGGEIFEDWKDPPIPMTTQFYLWAVENVEELNENPKARIKLIEKGPYTYTTSNVKADVRFSEDGEKARYRNVRSYVFDRSRSAGDDTEVCWFPNFFFISMVQMVQYEPQLLKEVADIAFRLLHDGIFVQHTVHEMLWGYEEPFLKEVTHLMPNLGLDDHMGYFLGINNSDNGNLTVFTGKSHPDKFNIIESWNGQGIMSLWANTYGNMINGSDGSLFPPFVDRSRRLEFFWPDVCRSFYSEYTHDTQFKGISLLHHTIPETVLASVKDNPDNLAFCTPSGRDSDCLPGGTVNISVCKHSAILAPGQVMSWPHFVQGDPSLRARFDGFSPDVTKHMTFLDIEPLTGAVMHTAIRLQLNIYVQPVKGFQELDGWDPVILPLMWFQQEVEISDSLAKEIRGKLHIMKLLNILAPYGTISIGVVSLIVGILLLVLWRRKQKNEDTSKLLVEPDERTGLQESADTAEYGAVTS